jgi:GNAT superfamily N-acetyltransferase
MGIELVTATSDEELQAGLDVLGALRPETVVELDELKAWQALVPGSLRVNGLLDGAIAGCASVNRFPGATGDVANARVDVLAHARRRGLGSALYGAISRHAAGVGVVKLDVWIGSEEADGLAFAEHRGFSEVMRVREVELDLGSTTPAPVEPPPGVDVVSLAERPDLGPGMYEVGLEAIPDMPSLEPIEVGPYETWKGYELDVAMRRPDLTTIALAGDEVIGYAVLSERAGGRLGKHRLTGVKRAWRGRGVARALKQAQIAAARASGMERLITENADGNAPMRAVNARLGYRPRPDVLWLRGPLAPRV